MPKVSKRNLGDLEGKIIKDLWKAINLLSDEERVTFLYHLFTPTELKMFAKRLAILKEVKERKHSYLEIRYRYGVMPNTVARIANIIHRADAHFIKILDKIVSKISSK